ncbi:nicotinate-nucleotide--dimethylbenzimidazole phosphoribosyltransferase [Sphingomonas sp. PB4P5]|uniref:nicotinate-nucleotide--dimethylbenzimidazole phosphoribosyltransferase n=1 Tax=Parasphingomonas puruogangriensis TaxID=3096155 RepID=UPI002FC9EC5C
MTAFATPADFLAALGDLPSPDTAARVAATARQGQLTKPPGSLGRLEDIAVFFAGWQARERPAITQGRAVIFAGNHGVVTRGVSAFPAAVTAQMVANFAAGGAAINALAAAAGLTLEVVPIALDHPTADFTQAPAMTAQECLDALNIGAAAIAADTDLLVLGEMGIGNSTAAAALCAASFGGDIAGWVGPGTGIDAEGIARKVATVAAGLATHAGHLSDPFEILRRLGGREIAAIAGAVLAARHRRIPVVLDGFICSSAIAPLAAAHPGIVDHCLAGHCSTEPGHGRLLEQLGLEPLLRLDLRLGEGSGAAVAVGVIRAALLAHERMATFAEAGVAAG